LRSERLSSLLTLHSLMSAITLLLAIVRSILLDPLFLKKVALSLSLFIKCKCLLARNSSSFLPREFVLLSCHVFDLELLSTTINILPTLVHHINSSILLKLISICYSKSKYMLVAKNFHFSCVIPTTTASSSDNFVISIASMLLFIIIMAALMFTGSCFAYSVLSVDSCYFDVVFIWFMY